MKPALLMCYDGQNRLTQKSTHSDCSSPLASYTYDAGTNGIGHLTGETFASGPDQSVTGSYSYAYDALGEEIGWTMSVGGTSYPFTMNYNDAGQQISLIYPDGDTLATAYDANGWQQGVSETPQGGSALPLLSAPTYTGVGGASELPTSAQVGNGTYTWNWTYDGLARLTGIQAQATSGGNTLFNQTRTFDAVGNVASVNTTLPAGTDSQAFCYDEQNRLTWAGSTGTPACGTSLTPGTLASANYTQAFNYDTNDRMTAGPLGTYTYGASPLHAVTSTTNGYSAQYDAAGDMTCRTVDTSTTCAGSNPTGQTLGYDALRELLTWQNAATNPTQTANYAYDGEGHRVQQTVTNNGTTTTTTYVGNYEQIGAVTGGATTTTKYYSAGPIQAISVNGTISYLVNDGLGSVAASVDETGNVTSTQLYAPFGTVRYTSGVSPTTKGFTGQQSDPSGLDFYNARYYDPVAGQFTSADSDAAGGLDHYAYVHGNPETLTDPTGHRYTCDMDCSGGRSGSASALAPASGKQPGVTDPVRGTGKPKGVQGTGQPKGRLAAAPNDPGLPKNPLCLGQVSEMCPPPPSGCIPNEILAGYGCGSGQGSGSVCDDNFSICGVGDVRSDGIFSLLGFDNSELETMAFKDGAGRMMDALGNLLGSVTAHFAGYFIGDGALTTIGGVVTGGAGTIFGGAVGVGLVALFIAINDNLTQAKEFISNNKDELSDDWKIQLEETRPFDNKIEVPGFSINWGMVAVHFIGPQGQESDWQDGDPVG